MLLMQCVITAVKVTPMMNKSYSELIRLPTFIERYNYLRLKGKVGDATFGFNRYLNQELYHSDDWYSFRDSIIIRDNGCNLGSVGFDISGSITIHHINPITYDDVINRSYKIFNPENAISTDDRTHKAIHYGDEKLLILPPIERTKNDTCPWRQ